MNTAYQTYRIEVVSPERVRFEKRDGQNKVLEERPASPMRYQEKQEAITELVDRAYKNELNDASDVRQLGEILFDILFSNEAICEDFVRFYTEVVQQKKQFLRVELDIDEEIMPDLAALPWEFMCLPTRFNQQEIWFGTDPNIVFSRHRTLWTAPPAIQLTKDEPLKIVLVVASPSNLCEFNYQPVKEALYALVAQQPERIQILEIVEQADRSAINDVLEKEPHILHFIGHGQLKKTEKFGQIALVDRETGKADWIDAVSFGGLFAKHRPRIVVLQACEGGAGSSSQAFSSVTSKVVQANVPVVLAMQYLVPIFVANRFASCFYEQVAKEFPVDVAAQLGRLAIALEPPYYECRNFATPMIFIRGQDGYLFERVGTEVETLTPESARLVTVIQRIKNLSNASATAIRVSEGEGGTYHARSEADNVTDGASLVGFESTSKKN
jgi:CHAT domain